jgi:ATP-binding cassette subfamily B protein
MKRVRRLIAALAQGQGLLSQIYRALHLVWQSGPRWTLASGALIVVQGLLPLVALYCMKLVVDAVAATVSGSGPADAVQRVFLLMALAAVVALVGAGGRALANLVNDVQIQQVTDHMYDILHAKSTQADLAYYENPKYYDTLHRAQEEAPERPQSIVQDLLQLGQNSISLIAMLGLLISFHWSVVAVLGLAALPAILVRFRYANTLYRWERDRTPLERQTSYLNWLLTGDVYAKEIRLFNLGPHFIQQFHDARSQLRHEKLRMTARYSLADLGTQLCATIAVFGVLAVMTYRALHGLITLGDLVMYYQAVQRGQGLLVQVLHNLGELYEDTLFLSNLYEFLDLKPAIVEPAQPKRLPRSVQAKLTLDHVSFQYPNNARKVLDDICLTIRPGEHVAFVGENGAGKTTLIKLLCRLYDPSAGRITLDEIDLRELETVVLRQQISAVFQDFAHYHATAWENIWYGHVNSPPEREQIVAAACHAGADSVIAGLPHGYDTILGKWFDTGAELSIGEWQKVALARAFLRDAPFIVLDEPTSAMDAQAEYDVFQTFRQLAKERAAIFISHRLSTVKMADRIYVLEDGRIVESGAHDDLMRQGGTYARLFAAQAQSYR